MKHLSSVPWIYREDLIFPLMELFDTPRVGEFDTEMVREFFYAISYTAGMNLHMKVLSGTNSHHIIEALFKAFAKALDEAVTTDPRIHDILSTKGSL